MYKDFFGLKEAPFTISPNPRYLFMSERHRDALAHLLYGIGEGGGFVLLTGEVGTGKTTVCRCLLEQIPHNVRLAFILNPKLNAIELMATMCDELGIHYEKGEDSLKAFTDLLTHYLLQSEEKGLNTVLMIDEAQNLSVEVLEQIRLLTNLETHHKKLLQIILIGQPELQELLAKKELRQLAQRITARYHLRPLSVVETKSYIEHRLRIAGSNRPIFKENAIKQIHKASQGVPRLINVICDRAMLGAFTRQNLQVDSKVVQMAMDEVLGVNAKPLNSNDKSQSISKNNLWKFATGALFVALISVLAYQWFNQSEKNNQNLSANYEQVVLNDLESGIDNNVQNENVQNNKVQNKSVQKKTIDEIAHEFWGKQSWDRNGNVSAKNLLALWGVEYLPFQSSAPCQFAENYSLSCDAGMANWDFLAKLNRPVNLKFYTAQSGVFWGTLLAMEQDQLLLQFGDNQVRTTKYELNPLWSGEYQLLWKRPLGFQENVTLGARGQVMEWFNQQVLLIDGSYNQNPTFTDQSREWVVRFQENNGLLADGIIGRHTVMMINNLTIENIPELNKDKYLAEVAQ